MRLSRSSAQDQVLEVGAFQVDKACASGVFGPVLPVVSYKTEDEAITLANDTIYGLGGYIYTAGRARAEKLASLMQTGSISHNDAEYLGPHNPFGRYKMSGFRKTGGKTEFTDSNRSLVPSMQPWC